MKTKYQQLTGRVLDQLEIIPEEYSVDQFYRVQFFSLKVDDGVKTQKYFNTSYCSDFYADKKDDAILTSELSGEKYVCPDTEQIELLNMPIMYQAQHGISFYMVVNSCVYAE